MSQPMSIGTLDSSGAMDQPDSASAIPSPVTSSNTASSSDEDSTFDLPKWDSHAWRAETVHKLINASPKIIQLTATRGKKRATVSVHVELLCYYSTYYRAALQGSFEEAGSKSLDAKATKDNLNLLVSWLYGGILHLSAASKSNMSCLASLYIFADRFDMLALRRHIIGDWCKLPAIKKIVNYNCLNYFYEALSTSSPIIQFIVDAAAKHQSFSADSLEDAFEKAPKAYFYAVLKAREVSANSPALENSKKGCPCCHDACRYHEHESDEERKATCGK